MFFPFFSHFGCPKPVFPGRYLPVKTGYLPKPSNRDSWAPGKFKWYFRYAIFKWILVIDGWGISCEITLIWLSLDFTDDGSTLVQVMAWCRQATRHCLSQCWPTSLSPYGVTRPQWVNKRGPCASISIYTVLLFEKIRLCEDICLSRKT